MASSFPFSHPQTGTQIDEYKDSVTIFLCPTIVCAPTHVSYQHTTCFRKFEAYSDFSDSFSRRLGSYWRARRREVPSQSSSSTSQQEPECPSRTAMTGTRRQSTGLRAC